EVRPQRIERRRRAPDRGNCVCHPAALGQLERSARPPGTLPRLREIQNVDSHRLNAPQGSAYARRMLRENQAAPVPGSSDPTIPQALDAPDASAAGAEQGADRDSAPATLPPGPGAPRW